MICEIICAAGFLCMSHLDIVHISLINFGFAKFLQLIQGLMMFNRGDLKRILLSTSVLELL